VAVFGRGLTNGAPPGPLLAAGTVTAFSQSADGGQIERRHTMADLSLKEYLRLQYATPDQGVRSCCAPFMRATAISLRSLLTSPRIIHLSDLHFTNNDHTWDSSGIRDTQNSAARIATLAGFLNGNRNDLGMPGNRTVVITGDLTDSGGDKDYPIAQDFIGQLSGFDVYVIPGNHDYCWEGNLFLRDALMKVRDTAIASAVIALVLGGPAGAVAAAAGTLYTALTSDLPGLALAGTWAFLEEVAGMMIAAAIFDVIGIWIAADWDSADNSERRQRFIGMISRYADKYPRVVECANGRLILLDSMQEELDRDTGHKYGEGMLGNAQLTTLDELVTAYQPQRAAGKRLAVCLHHKPFDNSGTVGLCDAGDLWTRISNRVDCLLFGHESNDPWEKFDGQYGIPLINCENLEHIDDAKPQAYPITVLDLGTYRRIVFYTDDPSHRETSWGGPP
jgi:3',5'-cyclic AMP phosphodiesterase CpdA